MIDRTTLRNCKYRACLFIIRSKSTQLQPFLHRFNHRDFSFCANVAAASTVFVVVVTAVIAAADAAADAAAVSVLKSFYHSCAHPLLYPSAKYIYIIQINAVERVRERESEKTVLLLKLIYIYLCYPLRLRQLPFSKTKINALLNCLYIKYIVFYFDVYLC